MLAGAVMVAAAVGVALHINENYVAVPLDQRYEQLWAGMSEVERWWAAFSKAVGPAPTFAPAALALVALVLIGRSATRRCVRRRRQAAEPASCDGTAGATPSGAVVVGNGVGASADSVGVRRNT